MEEIEKIREKAATYQGIYRKELLENVVPFWMNSDLLDDEYGGYRTSVDRQGKWYNQDKSIWFQGRGLWTFSALCSNYGQKEEWKNAAELGLRFLEEHGTDKDGRMFFQVTRDGQPLRKRRYMFSESFYVLGMAEYGAAFGDDSALEKAAGRYDLMLRMYKDPGSDPYKITPKFYEDVRSERTADVLMVLLSGAQLLSRCMAARGWKKERIEPYEQAAGEIAGDILRYHFKPDMACLLETVLSDGTFLDTPAGRCLNPGHACENAWFLMNLAMKTEDKELLSKALLILEWSLERGWDKEYDGMLYFVDVHARPCEKLEWDMKLWWVHNEALIATLLAYGLTGDGTWWQWYEKIHQYTFSHFPDREYGEWYGYLHRDGTVSHTQKGSMWKGPFHLPRCLMIGDKLLGCIAAGKAIHPIL